MHATSIKGAAGGSLYILEHCGLPNRHAAIEGIQVIENTMAGYRQNRTRRQAS